MIIIIIIIMYISLKCRLLSMRKSEGNTKIWGKRERVDSVVHAVAWLHYKRHMRLQMLLWVFSIILFCKDERTLIKHFELKKKITFKLKSRCNYWIMLAYFTGGLLNEALHILVLKHTC